MKTESVTISINSPVNPKDGDIWIKAAQQPTEPKKIPWWKIPFNGSTGRMGKM